MHFSLTRYSSPPPWYNNLLHTQDENRCDIVLRTFSCLVDAIGDLAFSRDFPSCLIDSGRSTDMKCARGNYQLSALQAVTLQPNFTAQFCKTN